MCKRVSNQRCLRTTYFLSALIAFAIANLGQSALGGCGDYLHHHGLSVHNDGLSTDAAYVDKGNDSHPRSRCQGPNCRPSPSTPPALPYKAEAIRRQTADFRLRLSALQPLEMSFFEFGDEELPLSATIEVLTPPPIESSLS